MWISVWNLLKRYGKRGRKMLPDQEDMKEFVTRCGSDEFQVYVNESQEKLRIKYLELKKKYKMENPDKYHAFQKKYSISEKGKIACRNRMQNRAKREKEA